MRITFEGKNKLQKQEKSHLVMTVLVIYAKLLLKMSLKCLNFFFLLTWTFPWNSPIQNLFIYFFS